MLLLTSLLLLPLPLALAAAVAVEERQNSCSDVHMFLARGNGEDYPGRVGDMASDTCGGIANCDYENIQFTSVQGSVYCSSVAEGASNGISQITAYNQRCPKTKLVLAGYSLGAHVVGDILGGGGGDFYDCVENGNYGLSASSLPGSAIVAAVLFGDVRHTSGQPYNVGTGSGEEGEYPRTGAQLNSLNQFANKLQNYCLVTDPICALGNDGLSHTTYMEVFGTTAGSWIQQMVSHPVQFQVSISPSSSPSSTVSSTSSSTASSSTSSSASSVTSAAHSSNSTMSSSSSTKSSSSSIPTMAYLGSSTSTSSSSTSTIQPTISVDTVPTSTSAAPSTTSAKNDARPTGAVGYSLSFVSLVVVIGAFM